MFSASEFNSWELRERKYRDAALGKTEEASIPKKLHDFSPYNDNGGTVVAVAGPKFVIVAGDTRLSEGYSILSRKMSKLVQLSSKTFMATAGQNADFVGIQKVLKARLTAYQFNINREPSTQSVAQLVSYTLYGKRFFPFYTFNIVAGLDENDNGVVYGYDAVGSFNTLKYAAQGSAQAQLAPLLDNMLQGYNKEKPTGPTTVEETEAFVVDCFSSVAERDIYTGDQIEVVILEAGGKITKRNYPLRRD